MFRMILIILFLSLVLAACGDNPTPAPAAVVEVTRIVEVTKLVEVTRMVAAPTTSAPAATPTLAATIAPAATTAPAATIAPTKTTAAATTAAAQQAITMVVNGNRKQENVETRKPKSGFTYYIVDFTVTNATGKPLLVGPNYFKVQSDQNFSYEYSDVSYLLPKGLKSTTLEPNDTTRGELAFEVPTGEIMKSARFENVTGLKVTVPIQ